MMMEDIDRIRDKKEKGPGFIFIDGSETGQTLKNVLGYSERVGFKKVILIDPDSRFRFGKLAPLNPIHTDPSLIQKSVSQLTEAFRVIFSVKDPAQIAYIENYLPAIFRVIASAGCTLYDLLYFADYDLGHFRELMAEASKDRRSIHKLEFAYKTPTMFSKELGSTMRRIDTVFRDEGLLNILSHRQGLDFAKLVADRWIILVDLSEMDILPGRLLSSLVINETIFGLKRLTDNGWKGCEYLYIDEAARYATNQIADILNYRRQLGLRLVLSHQHMGQFRDNPELAVAIDVNAKTKIAFYISGREERDKVVRMMYGGELSDREVSYNLSEQEKQSAIVKLNKKPTRKIKIHDTPVYKVSEAYLKDLFSNPWYYTIQEIKQDTNDRFRSADTSSSDRVVKPDRRKPGKADPKQAEHSPGSPEKASPKKAGAKKARTKSYSAWDSLDVPPKGTEGTDG